MQYATPDATELARQVAALMPHTEPIHVHASRGLDHGAWVPLKVMYPYGDVPVLQLSMPTHDPERLFSLGRRLQPLRAEGVLVIGSGFMTHGLPFATRDMFENNAIPGWSKEFDLWVAEALASGDFDTLANYKTAPGMPYAHPTAEHFTPLFIALGAATGVPVDLLDERWTSQAAELSLDESKGGRKNRRAAVDSVAATLLLRTYLERQVSAQAPRE